MRQRKWISVVALVAALLNIGVRLNHNALMPGLSPQLAGLLGDISVRCSAGSAIAPGSQSDQRPPWKPIDPNPCLRCAGAAAAMRMPATEPFLMGAAPAATPTPPGSARASDHRSPTEYLSHPAQSIPAVRRIIPPSPCRSVAP